MEHRPAHRLLSSPAVMGAQQTVAVEVFRKEYLANKEDANLLLEEGLLCSGLRSGRAEDELQGELDLEHLRLHRMEDHEQKDRSAFISLSAPPFHWQVSLEVLHAEGLLLDKHPPWIPDLGDDSMDFRSRWVTERELALDSFHRLQRLGDLVALARAEIEIPVDDWRASLGTPGVGIDTRFVPEPVLADAIGALEMGHHAAENEVTGA
jgi:hypothetical protein